MSTSEAVLTSSGRSEGVSVVVAGPREPEGPDRGGTGGTRELPDARVRASVRTLLLGAGSHLRGDSRSCADSRGSGDHRLREASARRPGARQGPIPGLILRFTRARGAKGPSRPRRKLPELPRWSLLIGKSGSRSPRVPEVDQQDDEERRAYDIYVEHHSYVTRIVVTCAHHLADVDRGSAQEPDGGCDHGHYQRVDVLESSRHVKVSLKGEVVAETGRPEILFETGLPSRYYIPPEDVVWYYLEPLSEAEGQEIKDHLCFYDEKVDLQGEG